MQASMERLASLLSRLPLGTLRTTVRKWAHNLRGTSSAAPAADARLAVQRASNALKQLLQREGLAPGSDSARMRHPAIVVGFVQDVAGEREVRPAVRRVGAPALLDGNVGEQMLEGAGARFVGADALGNRYYQRVERDTPWLRQRFVVYSEVTQGRAGDAYDASKVQTEGWFSWLHYVTDTPPTKLPGTWPVYGQGRDVTWMGNPDDADFRYQPKGSWYQGDKRRNWIPFAMWTPPGKHRREAKRKAVQSEWKTFKGT